MGYKKRESHVHKREYEREYERDTYIKSKGDRKCLEQKE